MMVGVSLCGNTEGSLEAMDHHHHHGSTEGGSVSGRERRSDLCGSVVLRST